MQITFALNKNNYWQCVRHLLRAPALIKANLIALGRIALIMALIAVVMILLSWFSWTLVAADVFILGVFAFAMLDKRRHVSLAQITPGVMGQITVTLRPENVSRKSTVQETIVPWHSFVGIKRHQDGILLLMSDRVAQVIPGDAFASSAELEGFYQTALEYWEAAKSGRPISSAAETQTWPPPPTSRG